MIRVRDDSRLLSNVARAREKILNSEVLLVLARRHARVPRRGVVHAAGARLSRQCNEAHRTVTGGVTLKPVAPIYVVWPAARQLLVRRRCNAGGERAGARYHATRSRSRSRRRYRAANGGVPS